ncbi:hypothetical protein T265_12139 [Opisthorchis viverrini]|uniref:Uncharacterized protein n=2 Tax=Opisthorchis viverrini TaxID=6198 RepID=A0A074YVN4_OPIVI|nr:hypothetical protein T265_12139 [Opisthorchis viverrini]KER18831.1 hypothetical protein T265_12139 [Opisthorchis viverrini]
MALRRRRIYARRRFRRRATRFARRFRKGLRSRFVCRKFISVIDVNTDRADFEIAPKVEDFKQAKCLLDLYRRFRIKGISVRYRSDIRGAMATWSDLGSACVRLGCSPIAYKGQYTQCSETDCLRIKGFYREFVLQRDFAINRKALWVNGDKPEAKRNPRSADPKLPHYGLYFKFCNLSPEYQAKVKRAGKLYTTAYIQFRDRKLAD